MLLGDGAEKPASKDMFCIRKNLLYVAFIMPTDLKFSVF